MRWKAASDDGVRMSQPYAILRDGTRWTPGTPFPADYPGAIVVPAHPSNFGYVDRVTGEPLVNEPISLGFHTPEEQADDVESTPYYFQRPNLGACTEYYHDNDGDVYQMVPETVGAFGNGVVGKPPPAWVRAHWPLNLQSLKTEMEGRRLTIHRTMTRPQWGSVIDWTRFEMRRYPEITVKRLFGHYQVSAERTDPGVIIMQRLWKEIGGGGLMQFERRNSVAAWFTGRTLNDSQEHDGVMQAVSDFGVPAGVKALKLEVFPRPVGAGEILFFDGDTPDGSMVGYAGRVRSQGGLTVVDMVGLGSNSTIRFRVQGGGVILDMLGLLGVWR